VDALPGSDLIARGILDLSRGIESVEALVVSIGAPRLRTIGLPVARAFPDPERRLYALLAHDGANDAHSRYNGLIRRLVSYERAAECANPQT
jgi:hypothetical protein